ncbi:MAG: TRAP transporter substrate-binding protein [Flavobacteriales bacterium]|nr:TRAP transporter substrate-binding protein [Flavobacteriales bacterium]
MLALFGCAQKETVKTLRLAHSLDPAHPVHLAFEFMAKKVAEQSGGKLTMEIYPSGQLGAERELLELLQIGSVDMTKVSSAVLEGFAPEYKVFGLPYLFIDREHAFRVLDGAVGTHLLEAPENFWLHGLCFYDAGARSFYTRDHPVNSPDDVKGLKIRVMKSIQAVSLVNGLGASATPISWGELYTALQSGVVDGAENNPPSFYTSRHYEICKYYSLNEHTRVPDVLLMSLHTWEKLSEQEKSWIEEAARQSVVYQRELWKKSEDEALEAVKKAGVEVTIPDRKTFADKVSFMHDEAAQDPAIKEILQRIKETK